MDTRTHILSEALRLFAFHGYDAVGVQTIVEAAGVTKPTLYHHFGSKKGLFEALVREYGEPLLEIVREAAVYEHDLAGTLKRLLAAYFTYGAEHPVFYRLLLAMWFAPPGSDYFDSVYTLLRTQHEMIVTLFEAAALHHGNMRGRQQAYAVSFKGLVDTYIGIALQEQLPMPDGEQINRITHQFMHGIFS
jgi:TetR/AcrR family transcriptional regulator